MNAPRSRPHTPYGIVDGADDNDDDDDDDKDDDDEEGTGREQPEAEIKVRRSHISARCFSRLILDEAHKAKSPLTLQAHGVALVEADTLVCLTATPMINTAGDLYGLLVLFWRNHMPRPKVDLREGGQWDTDFSSVSKVDPYRLLPIYDETLRAIDSQANWVDMLNLENFQPLLRVLHPLTFRQLLPLSRSGQIDVLYRVLRPILKLI